jgi:hypothetical protein
MPRKLNVVQLLSVSVRTNGKSFLISDQNCYCNSNNLCFFVLKDEEEKVEDKDEAVVSQAMGEVRTCSSILYCTVVYTFYFL